MTTQREPLPAHILLGLAVLLFGLGLTLILQAVGPLPEWPGRSDEEKCKADPTCTVLIVEENAGLPT